MAVAVALGTDAFSLAVGMGMSGVYRRRAIWFALTVGILHVFLPLVGLVAGEYFGRLLGQVAAAVGATALLFIGGQLVWEGLRGAEASFPQGDNPAGLLGLAGSVSVDALTVGFGLGTLRVDLGLSVVIMGITAGSMTWTGFMFGRRLGNWTGERARLLGGALLLLIAVRLFWEAVGR